jgi:hypothetical protein
MSDPGAFAVAATEEQEDGKPPPLAGVGVVVCLIGTNIWHRLGRRHGHPLER